MDKIFISDLRLDTRIGVYDWEQKLSQSVSVNLEFALPSNTAFASDDFGETVDYAAVVKRLEELAKDHPYRLLERFAQAIADIVLDEFGAPWVSVRIAKLAPLRGVKQLGVAIERRREAP